MKLHLIYGALAGAVAVWLGSEAWAQGTEDTARLLPEANQWRQEHRLIDLHQHIDYTEEHLARAIRIMDRAGVGVGVDLSGGVVTHKEGEISAFERNKKLADTLYPGRFVHYMNLDYAGWDKPDFAERAARQIEEGKRLGAAGFKQEKSLGLYLRDGQGKLLRVDDPKLDPMWEKCGELGLPVSIHVADPRAFWLPYDSNNERWTELKDHRAWWFGDPNIYPKREELLAALDRVIARHPKTTFVCVHFANNAEELEWVEQALEKNPNMNADLAARIPEIGRHDPEKVRRLFTKFQDRIFFATDFQVYRNLTLGSGGSGAPPSDDDAEVFFEKHWRWLETNDRNFRHMTPIQGEWTISGIGLPTSVLRKIYFDNAQRLLARALPFPVIKAAHIDRDFRIEANPEEAAWKKASPVRMEYDSLEVKARPEISTEVRSLWSDHYLYLRYQCPVTELTVFDPPRFDGERSGLWDKDVVEAFICTDLSAPKKYFEYETAPTGEKLDLYIGGAKDALGWDSGFETKVKVADHTMWVEMKIPLEKMTQGVPEVGTKWRVNFYRIDRAHKAFLAWNPTLTQTYHTPARFGWMELVK